jgi:serine/threonine-protein kinase RsbW
MSNRVELSLPARVDLLSLVRLEAGAVSAAAGFALDGIEDLRLAVEELCFQVMAAPTTRLLVAFNWDDQELEVTASGGDPADGSSGWTALPMAASFPGQLSGCILDALVDEHGSSQAPRRAQWWLRKRHQGATR